MFTLLHTNTHTYGFINQKLVDCANSRVKTEIKNTNTLTHNMLKEFQFSISFRSSEIAIVINGNITVIMYFFFIKKQ